MRGGEHERLREATLSVTVCVTRPRRPPASRLARSLCCRETPDHLTGPRPGSQCARPPCVVLPYLPARPHGLLLSPLAGALATPAGFGLPNVLCPPTLAWTVLLSLLISKPPSSLSAASSCFPFRPTRHGLHLTLYQLL